MNNATPDDLSSERFLGRQFANYNVNSLIAKTHSGLVFQARSQTSDRFVALRILARSTLDTEAAEERFRRATTTVKKLNHPNIVQLLDAGRTQGYCYTVSQLIEGENAVDLIRRIGVVGMLDAASVLQIAVDLCEALRCIESHGILHRNIKPSNILITESNGRKVALLDDLVLAKTLGSSRQKQLTKAGELIGDVGYMSPEQLGSGFPVDQRSDIYQLGVTLYALLTGRELFSTGTMAHRMGAVLTELPPPIRSIQMATPPQFESLVLKMLKKNPSERFQNANELADALRQLAAVLNQSSVRPQERSPKDQGWSGGLEGLF